MHRLVPLLLLIAWAALVASVGPPKGDVANYLTAAALWLEGADLTRLYDYRWFTAQAARLGFEGQLVGFAVLTPPSALMLAPLWPLGPAGAAQAWWALQGVFGVGLAAALGALARPTSPRGARLAIGLALLLVAWPVLEGHLRQGQLHLPAALCLALALVRWRGKRDLEAGVWLGLAVGLKVHAWPLVALAAVARRGRIAGAAVATLLAGGAVSVALLGWDVHATYLREIGPAAAAGWFIDPWSPAFSSLGHLARAVSLPHPALLPQTPLTSPALAHALPAAAQAAVVGLTVASGLRFRRLDEAGRSRVVAAAGVAALASGPLLARYHLVLVLPAAAVALGVTLGRRRRWGAVLVALLVALCWAPAPSTWSPGWQRLVDLPRLGAALALWAALVPWRQRPVGLPAVAGVVALAALVGWSAVPGAASDDGARPLVAPGQPLVAADLSVDQGTLRLSGLPGAGHPAAGGGWVELRLDPGGGPPAWAARPGGHAFAAPTEPGARGPRPGPDGGLLEARAVDGNTDIWFVPEVGPAARLTTHPAHDAWPAWDPSRGRIWFLSDRGVGVRALRVWWLPWSPG